MIAEHSVMNSDSPVRAFTDISPSDEILFVGKEISHAIGSLKKMGRTGLDNIYSEYNKAGREPIINTLLHLFNCILPTWKIPQLFKEAPIVILKIGCRLDCGNYCPMGLLSHVYKHFVNRIS